MLIIELIIESLQTAIVELLKRMQFTILNCSMIYNDDYYTS